MPHAKVDPVKHCKICGVLMTRKRYPGGNLESNLSFSRREHCSQACANSREVVQADTHRWRARQVKPRTECQTCGATEKLHVHHEDRDVTNNDPDNLTTLCASCHLLLHWAEDRDARMASLLAHTRQPSSDGKRYLAGRRPHPLRSAPRADSA